MARGRSSVGRALDWQSRGQGFESPRLHQIKKPHNSVVRFFVMFPVEFPDL